MISLLFEIIAGFLPFLSIDIFWKFATQESFLIKWNKNYDDTACLPFGAETGHGHLFSIPDLYRKLVAPPFIML
jgi:hypothetical protein